MNSNVITKPATTAPMEMRLLTVLERRVKSVITTTDSSGRNKISQGKFSYFIRFEIGERARLGRSQRRPRRWPLATTADLNMLTQPRSGSTRGRVEPQPRRQRSPYSCEIQFSLQLHARQIFDVRGLAFAVERHNQREADRHFRRRHGDAVSY